MNTPSHEFVTVDLRGSKTELVARARADRVSVSSIVRSAVARELGRTGEPATPSAESATGRADATDRTVKLSIRLHASEAERLAAGARAAGLSRAAYLVGLIDAVPALTTIANRPNLVAAVVASTAELATLARSLRHLSALLRHGEVQAARPYREMLDTLSSDVHRHLETASTTLAQLRPRRPHAGADGGGLCRAGGASPPVSTPRRPA